MDDTSSYQQPTLLSQPDLFGTLCQDVVVCTLHICHFYEKGNFGCSDILRTIWQKVATAIFALLTGQCQCSALGLFGPSWCHEYLHACKVGSSCICTVNLFHDSRPPTHQTSTFTIGRGTNKTSNISQRF